MKKSTKKKIILFVAKALNFEDQVFNIVKLPEPKPVIEEVIKPIVVSVDYNLDLTSPIDEDFLKRELSHSIASYLLNNDLINFVRYSRGSYYQDKIEGKLKVLPFKK